MTLGGLIARLGAGLLALGLVALGFVAYQLWGSSLYADHAQSQLRAELSHQLHRRLAAPSAFPTTPKVQPPAVDLPPLATQPAPVSTTPPAGSAVALLDIPAIGLQDAIVQGTGEAQLEQGPGHYAGTPLPGEQGNAAVAGHRTTYAHPFYDLTALAVGDPVYVLTSQGFFRYDVARQFAVAPTDLSVLATTGLATLTLTTCTPRYSAAQRLVVVADFSPGTAPAPATTAASAPEPTTTTTTLPPRARGSIHTAGSGRHLLALAGTRSSTSGGSLGESGGSRLVAALWGVATVAAAGSTLVASRRFATLALVDVRWLPRWLPYVVGGAGCLALLFFFYVHLSLALPASF